MCLLDEDSGNLVKTEPFYDNLNLSEPIMRHALFCVGQRKQVPECQVFFSAHHGGSHTAAPRPTGRR